MLGLILRLPPPADPPRAAPSDRIRAPALWSLTTPSKADRTFCARDRLQTVDAFDSRPVRRVRGRAVRADPGYVCARSDDPTQTTPTQTTPRRRRRPRRRLRRRRRRRRVRRFPRRSGRYSGRSPLTWHGPEASTARSSSTRTPVRRCSPPHRTSAGCRRRSRSSIRPPPRCSSSGPTPPWTRACSESAR